MRPVWNDNSRNQLTDVHRHKKDFLNFKGIVIEKLELKNIFKTKSGQIDNSSRKEESEVIKLGPLKKHKPTGDTMIKRNKDFLWH